MVYEGISNLNRMKKIFLDQTKGFEKSKFKPVEFDLMDFFYLLISNIFNT